MSRIMISGAAAVTIMIPGETAGGDMEMMIISLECTLNGVDRYVKMSRDGLEANHETMDRALSVGIGMVQLLALLFREHMSC